MPFWRGRFFLFENRASAKPGDFGQLRRPEAQGPRRIQRWIKHTLSEDEHAY